MYFTRDPVIETIITAKDGHKLVIRNTKISSQEPFIVESVEVVSLRGGCFFRSSERAQPFFIPISDYDVVEVKDAKTTLKLPGIEKGIKIAGGRSANLKPIKELKNTSVDVSEDKSKNVELTSVEPEIVVHKEEKETWKKNKKKKSSGNKESLSHKNSQSLHSSQGKTHTPEVPSLNVVPNDLDNKVKKFSLLPPPPMLISEVINKFPEETEKNTGNSVERDSVIVSRELSKQNLDDSLENVSFFIE